MELKDEIYEELGIDIDHDDLQITENNEGLNLVGLESVLVDTFMKNIEREESFSLS